MKKKIEATIVADSMNQDGDRLTTFVVTFPRIILAEFNTHRAFSRNSASSRAIPFEKMVKMVEENPFIPIAWQKDHKGMQGTEYITDIKLINRCKEVWLHAKDNAIERACELHGDNWIEPENEHLLLDVTKQLCNRLLEPFMWHTVIVTCGKEGLENFFKLRCPVYESRGQKYHSKKEFRQKANQLDKLDCAKFDDLTWLSINKGQSEIHMMALAEAMYDAYKESMPYNLREGEWHIPFGDMIDIERLISVTPLDLSSPQHDIDYWKLQIAIARCARVSYLNFEGGDDYVADFKLYERLSSMNHWSPFEHVGQAMPEGGISRVAKGVNGGYIEIKDKWSGNFKGFIQYRKTFLNESGEDRVD